MAGFDPSTEAEGARLAPAALTGSPPVAREDPGRSPAGLGSPARRARKRAAATAVDALEGVCDVDLDVLDVELPRGFGRD